MKRIHSLLALALWAIVWEVSSRALQSDLVPPLSAIAAEAVALAQTQTFQNALGVTARAFLIGMALALAIGIPAGVLMGVYRPVEKALNVWVNVFISAPLTAVVPALMPLLGIGETTVVATVFLFAVWVIVIDTQAGVRHANRSLVEMSRMFGATRLQTLTKILVPSAMPEIMTGIRLGVVRGIKGVVIGQIVVALVGFGGLFERYSSTFQMERFWALVLIVFVMAFIIVETLAFIEKRFDYYARSR